MSDSAERDAAESILLSILKSPAWFDLDERGVVIDGSVSLDDGQVAYLRSLMDRVFPPAEKGQADA